MSLFGLVGGSTPAAAAATAHPAGLAPLPASALPSLAAANALQPARGVLDGVENVGKPPLTTRLATAFKAAMRELGVYKGPVNGVADQQLQSAVLALQARDASARAKVAKPAAGSGSGTAGKPVAHTWKHAKPAPKPRPQTKPAFNKPAPITGNSIVSGQQVQTPSGIQLPAGFTPVGTMPQGTMVTPGGIVIPATTAAAGTNAQASLQGLQGLPPQIQAQLGLVPQGLVPFGTPTTMYGANGQPLTGPGADVPQANATNQQGIGAGAAGANQAVTNRNAVDVSSRNLGQDPYGFGYGAGFGAGYGVGALPYGMSTGYGASMNGSLELPQQGGIRGFFRRLLD